MVRCVSCYCVCISFVILFVLLFLTTSKQSISLLICEAMGNPLCLCCTKMSATKLSLHITMHIQASYIACTFEYSSGGVYRIHKTVQFLQ